MKRFYQLLCTITAFFLLLITSTPQVSALTPTELFSFPGAASGDLFGFSAAGAGDVNQDGTPDIIVGAPFNDVTAANAGAARVHSGKTGSVLYNFFGDSANDQFGASVSGAGDVNADGYQDLVVGAYRDDNTASNSGSARVFSGQTGAILYTFNGDASNDSLGLAVAGVGDVNKDGFADIIAGAPLNDANGTDAGLARVYSGSNGTILYTFKGDLAGDNFGWAVAGIGDFNNDTYPDIAVGAPRSDANGTDSGLLRIFSGQNGSILTTINGEGLGDNFGKAVSGAGDVDLNGIPDLVVGAPQFDIVGALDVGKIYVFSSGVSPLLLFSTTGTVQNGYLGYSVSGAGDVNADGYPDIVFGSISDLSGGTFGSAQVYSGKDGTFLCGVSGTANLPAPQGASMPLVSAISIKIYSRISVWAFMATTPLQLMPEKYFFLAALPGRTSAFHWREQRPLS
jgi:hypothetical protein